MRAHFGLICFVLLLHAGAVHAQHLAPTPKKSPTMPVKSHNLTNAGKKIPLSRLLQGKATIINTQTLSLNGFKIRLFGIVPPYLGASYGPQARAVMDSLATANTTCKVLDRQRDGHYLARCRNDKNQDFGLELLRRGLAVTARGSIKHTDVERNYIAAEQTAQSTRLGLWSIAVPKAASSKRIQDQATKMARAKIAAAAEKIKEKARTAQAAKEQEAKVKAQALTKKPVPMPTVSLAEGTSEIKIENIGTVGTTSVRALTADEILAALSQPPLDQPEIIAPLITAPVTASNFWERFQLMITGLLMLSTALIIVGTISLQRWLTRREEVRAIAAALRGELMAARSICKARISKIEDEQSEDDIAWPRLRTLVFQAYVGRIGNLGAELSRQIASIYGQASDYAAYYRSHNGKDAASKHRALEALVHHIDEINPRLAMIEQSGTLRITPVKPTYGHLKLSSTRHDNLSLPAAPQEAYKTQPPVQAEPQIEVKKIISDEMAQSLTQAKAEIENIPAKERPSTIVKTEKVDQTPTPPKPRQKPTNKKSKINSKTKNKKEAIVTEVKNTPEQTGVMQKSKTDKAMSMINFAAPIFKKITQLKDKASIHLGTKHKSQNEFSIPDYANLTDTEIEDLLFAEEEMLLAATDNNTKQAG